jgi:hypothetical protein
MTSFAMMQFPVLVLAKFNICHIFLQVVTIVDIADGTWKQITDVAWNGKPAINLTAHLQWGWQPRPPESFWTLWRQALSKLCCWQCEIWSPLGWWAEAGKLRTIR